VRHCTVPRLAVNVLRNCPFLSQLQLDYHVRRDLILVLDVHAFLSPTAGVLPGSRPAILHGPLADEPSFLSQIFLTHGVGTGVGIGFLLLPSMSLIGQHFKQRRPLASGIAFTGASVGGIVIPQLVNNLVPEEGGKLGWGNGMRVIAGVLTACVFGGLALMRRRIGTGIGSISEKHAEIARAQQREERLKHQLARYAKEAEYVWVFFGSVIVHGQ